MPISPIDFDAQNAYYCAFLINIICMGKYYFVILHPESKAFDCTRCTERVKMFISEIM